MNIIIITTLIFFAIFIIVFDDWWLNLLPKAIFFDAYHGYREKDDGVRNDK